MKLKETVVSRNVLGERGLVGGCVWWIFISCPLFPLIFIFLSTPMYLFSPVHPHPRLCATSSPSYPSLHPLVLFFITSSSTSSLHHPLNPPFTTLSPPMSISSLPSSSSPPCSLITFSSPSCPLLHHLFLNVIAPLPSTPTLALFTSLSPPIFLSSPPHLHPRLNAPLSPLYPSLHHPVLFFTPFSSTSLLHHPLRPPFPSSPPDHPPCPSLHPPIFNFSSIPPHHPHILFVPLLSSLSQLPHLQLPPRHLPVHSSTLCSHLHLPIPLFISSSPSLPSLPILKPPSSLCPFLPHLISLFTPLCATVKVFHCKNTWWGGDIWPPRCLSNTLWKAIHHGLLFRGWEFLLNV